METITGLEVFIALLLANLMAYGTVFLLAKINAVVSNFLKENRNDISKEDRS